MKEREVWVRLIQRRAGKEVVERRSEQAEVAGLPGIIGAADWREGLSDWKARATRGLGEGFSCVPTGRKLDRIKFKGMD